MVTSVDPTSTYETQGSGTSLRKSGSTSFRKEESTLLLVHATVNYTRFLVPTRVSTVLLRVLLTGARGSCKEPLLQFTVVTVVPMGTGPIL